MARKTFLFADFSPPVWRAVPIGPVMSEPAAISVRVTPLNALGADDVLDVSPPLTVGELAPDGVDREELRTTFHALSTTAHDAFGSFSVRHDEVRKIRAYADTEGDDRNFSDGSDDVVERSLVQPKDFQLHELLDSPGQAFITTQEAVVRRIFRRARETYSTLGIGGIALNLRNTNLEDLEAALHDGEIIGYKLVDVMSNTPITTYDVLGEDISNNKEIQDARSRAGEMKGLAVRLQQGSQIIAVWVYQGGAVTFLAYPGDGPGLGLLNALNSIIASCSALELATVR